MDPTKGLHACQNCGREIWRENPGYPLCGPCVSAGVSPAVKTIPVPVDEPEVVVADSETSAEQPAGQSEEKKR